MKIARVANRDMVMAGLFNPIEISDDMIGLALERSERKAAQPLPLGKLGTVGANLTGQSLTGKFRDPRVQSTARASEVLGQEEIDKILTGST